MSVLLLLCCCKKEFLFSSNTLFTQVPISKSGIDFRNTITENDAINVADFQYCYNGGGVGIGDFNNDGLPDIVFSGNQVSSRLYLNTGDLTFKDISKEANFTTDTWVTGISIVDINTDGFDDIYLNVGGPACENSPCTNLLFINQGVDESGIPRFIEKAREFGLDDSGYSQQTVFFDYDLDGDLDAFIIHNGNTKRDRNTPLPKRYFPEHLKDKLLENQKDSTNNQAYFKDVSEDASIIHKGFSLGVAIHDFNNDHLPDIYVSNDFITNDLVYINQGTNTAGIHQGFKNIGKEFLAKQSFNAMGTDVADYNNDLWPDIVVVDMLPNDYERQKKMLGFHNYDKYLLSLQNGYTPQYIHNTLQHHNGMLGTNLIPTSEIGVAAGISSTDWSWAPLLADYDNDGDKDLYITNGYVKDITDLDFINYSKQNNMFGTPGSQKEKLKKLVHELPGIYLPNYSFKNNKQLEFENSSAEWFPATPSFSNGVAYADLDLDHDLDLIVNNINDPAFIFENHTNDHNVSTHFIRIKLEGTKENKKGIGANIHVWTQESVQQQYVSTIRGYLSSVEPIAHFGLPSDRIDSLQVQWPDGKISTLKDVQANQVITISYTTATDQKITLPEAPLFQLENNIFTFKHQENYYNDFTYQSLLPYQSNANGPCLSIANINQTPGEEIFIGGSKGVPGSILAQDDQGTYKIIQELDSEFEDQTSQFVDIDQDGDQDLLVGSGGTETKTDTAQFQDRIYLNNGKGFFTRDTSSVFSKLKTNSRCIAVTQDQSDANSYIFIGGGVLPNAYPKAARSYIIKNQKHVSTLQFDGIVTDAIWTKLLTDSKEELVIAGHWMPLTLMQIENNNLKEIPVQWQDKAGHPLEMSGWWNTVKMADFDNDGDMDLIAGNQGINGFIRSEFKKPLYIYKEDYDQNGSVDPILAKYFLSGTDTLLQPIHTRDDVMKQLVSLKKNYSTYTQFSKATFQELLEITDLKSQTLQASVFESVYAENVGNYTFRVHALPPACQIAPINDFVIEDFNQDGYPDVLAVGNNYSSEANYGRQDASNGWYLQGSADGFTLVPNSKSGFIVSGQSNHMALLSDQYQRKRVIVTQNNDSIKSFMYANPNHQANFAQSNTPSKKIKNTSL
ncbi:CRTAC1 family protein [Aquimarina sp. ERC-38]|uniref:CRTAC1 family protein n=1 Tax=Aquimarina sp. ERC-38 TaxID=2949996 RepID=UPI00224759D1|nr:CRTAC1 family protein [Aquimarina sp. ERC-38]UZO81440.1 CRTAC1 family protein [Aquimarina sp. ERC-38]